MDNLGEIDYKNYESFFKSGDKRYAVRAVILKNDKLAMIYDNALKMYKFPGGGIKSGEDKLEALSREVNEETGLTIINSSVKELGVLKEIQASHKYENTVFEHISFMYFANCYDKIGATHLDAKEEARGLKLVFVTPKEVYDNNLAQNKKGLMDLREIRILEILESMNIIKL